MIRVHRIKNGSLVEETGTGLAALKAACETDPAWVEVVAPEEDELTLLAEGLGIHRLALADTLRIGHPPKLEEFDDYLFVIAHTPEADQEGQTRKIALFIARNWIVTVLRVPLAPVDEAFARARTEPGRYIDPPARLAHLVLDLMADGFEFIVEDLSDQIETLEQDALDDKASGIMDQILAKRQEVVSLRRVVRSQRDVALAMARDGHDQIPKRLVPYFRDIYDHLARVTDLLEGLREGVAAARDAHLTAVNNRLSEIMRVLTVIATIMMPLSLVAGIFGMNHEILPGTKGPNAFWYLMAAMLVLSGGMLWWFRRKRWL